MGNAKSESVRWWSGIRARGWADKVDQRTNGDGEGTGSVQANKVD